MDDQEIMAVTISDIAEVGVTPGYATITLKGGKSLVIGVAAAHQLMTILGEDRLLSVVCKYGDRKHAETIH